MRPNFDRVEQQAIDRAVKAAGLRFGLVRANVAAAATLPGARVQILIDPETGFPIEPDTDGLFYPGDLPNDDKELS